MNKKAFTLVELIVVITISAILGTIAFISLQGYSRDSRDSVRISDLKNIQTGLELYKTKIGKYPTPDNYVDITASGIVFSYQGVVGDSLLSKVRINGGGKDPVDQSFYTYMTTSNLYQYELMGFLENGNVAGIFPQANAVGTYTNRFPKVIGDELGILLDSTTNEPIQSTGTGVDILNTTTNYKALFSNTNNITGTGGRLFTQYYNRTRKLLTDKVLAKQDPSLVLYMDMETTTTSGALIVLKDLSGYGNNGSCYNSGTIVDCFWGIGSKLIDSPNGKAVSYDGTGGIRVDYFNQLSGDYLTIFTVFKSRDLNTFELGRFQDIINQWDCTGGCNKGNAAWWLGLSNANTRDGSPLLHNKPTAFKLIKNYGIEGDGKWHNLTFKKEIKVTTLFLDGIKISTYNYNGTGTIIDTTLPLYIGTAGHNTYMKHAPGPIDEVRIYNRALSDVEIMELYNSNK